MQANTKQGSALPLLLAFFIGGPILLLLVIVCAIASFFWVGPEIRTLRNAALENSAGRFEKKLELNVGRASFATARLATSFIHDIPDEAKVALNSAKGAQVSIYKVHRLTADHAKIFTDADRKMEKRGWYRIVGVTHDDNTVAVYVPMKMNSPQNTEVCVLVLSRDQLVCAYGRTDLEPLFKIGMEKAKRECPQLAMQ